MAWVQPPGSVIPADRTEAALDLDLLLGGLKPVVQGLNPEAVNALTNSLIQILQGQEGNVESLFSRTSAFAGALADNSSTVQQLIDNLNAVLETIGDDGDKFSAAVDRLEKLVTGLAADRDPIGTAITALDNGSAVLTDLLVQARTPLAGTVDELARLAPLRPGQGNPGLGPAEGAQELPQAGPARLLRQLDQPVPVRHVGAGQRSAGRTAYFPWILQHTGRCAEP